MHEKLPWVSRANETAAVRALGEACDASLVRRETGANEVAETKNRRSGNVAVLRLLCQARRVCEDEKALLRRWRDFCNSLLSATAAAENVGCLGQK